MEVTKENRHKLACKRLENILTKYGIANARTLEQKIADAGPSNQRIDPHILTQARRTLVQEGRIEQITQNEAPWYYLANTPRQIVERRLEEQLPIFRALQHGNLGFRVGQCLEIAIYRALLSQKTLGYLGGFRDLDEHDDSRRYVKEEPPQLISGNSLPRKQRLDFLIHH